MFSLGVGSTLRSLPQLGVDSLVSEWVVRLSQYRVVFDSVEDETSRLSALGVGSGGPLSRLAFFLCFLPAKWRSIEALSFGLYRDLAWVAHEIVHGCRDVGIIRHDWSKQSTNRCERLKLTERS